MADPVPGETTSTGRRPSSAGASVALLTITLVLMALNLRSAVASIGPVLRDMQLELGMSDTVAGILTTMPPICFGLFGLWATRFRRQVGTEKALVICLVALAIGPAIRALMPSAETLIVSSLIPLFGIGVGNVLVPVAVKAWFPDDVGKMTGWYSMAIATGTALPAAMTVPVAETFGTWRMGIGVWGTLAVIALMPWPMIVRARRRAAAVYANGEVDEPEVITGAAQAIPQPVAHPPTDDRATSTSEVDPATSTSEVSDAANSGTPGEPAVARKARPAVHRQWKTWALAVFFASQTFEAYVALGWLPSILQDAGLSADRAGLYLAVAMFLGAPISLILPPLAARTSDQRPWVVGLVASAAAGYFGLMFAPATLSLLWVIFLGIGLGAFPLALVLIGLRSATPEGTVALSSLAQGVGYLLAAMGPAAIGALRDLTGAWTVPLTVMLVSLVFKFTSGWYAAKPGTVD